MNRNGLESEMRGKLLFAAGLAAGYVVGARAGRPAYESIVDRAKDLGASPAVRQAGAKAKDTLEDRAPKAAHVAEQAATTVTETAAAAKGARKGEGGSASADSSSDA